MPLLPNPYKTNVNMVVNGNETVQLESADSKHFIYLRIYTPNRGEMHIGFTPEDFLAFAFGVNEAVRNVVNSTPTVLLRGNLSEGFAAYGPFVDFDAAASWDTANPSNFDSWIMHMGNEVNPDFEF